MTYREELIDLPDGRTLEVATFGSPAGATVFFHHGTPGSTRQLRLFMPLADYGDFYFVTASRPAYGRSSRDEGHSVASAVEDARAVLDHFGRRRYVALGWSGGGPRALASAALDATCLGALTVASVAPADADFDWTEGMGPENVEEFTLARAGGAPYEAYMQEIGGQLGALGADNLFQILGGLFGAADREALAGEEARAALADSARYGFEGGWLGYYDDNVAQMAPWGFDVSAIERPVHLFFGDADLMVPPTHGEWLAKNVPYAAVHRQGEDGHVSIFAEHFDEIAEVLSDLSI